MLDLKKLASKWQKKWEQDKVFLTKEDSKKKKYYVLEMFPYPSGRLHMGHVRNYSLGDAYARFKRMNGFNVLYPMGYDSFGLPAENAAIERKVDPKEWTEGNIADMRKQQKQLGMSYDWSREVVTCHDDYYRWTQWIFLKFLEKGLAYKKKSSVNWCPKGNTVLANEQVENGKCWRHTKTDVVQKDLDQWYFKITKYADELLGDLDKLKDWPERVKTMQRNWIGKSHGLLFRAPVKDMDLVIETFSTHFEACYADTFIVIAPDRFPLNSAGSERIPSFMSM